MSYTIDDTNPLAPAAKALQDLTTQLTAANAQLAAAPATLTARQQLVHDLIVSGKSWAALKVPYVWGGESYLGIDCSGFVQLLYGHYGISLPRLSYQQFLVGEHIDWHDVQPGDLLFFKYKVVDVHPADHVAIFIGDRQMLHTNTPPATVHVSDAVANFGAFVGARRVIGG